MQNVHVRCPKCHWEPDDSCRWVCDVCNTRWNTFNTFGKCPTCGKIYEETACFKHKGGCGLWSPHADWYLEYETSDDIESEKKSIWFWKNKKQLPITITDKDWVENDLLWLAKLFEPIVFKSLITITPDSKVLDRKLTGTEDDAQFIFKQLIDIMSINAWEIQLMFYSNRPTTFSEGIVATPSDKLKSTWSSSSGKYIDKGLGHKEIWIEEGQLKDSVSLIATFANELAHFKLLDEYRLENKDVLLAGLTAVVFGFGIFMGNSYFKFSQWTGTNHQGWQMQRRGGLPEQVIAYAMAWLAHYRAEDISWKQHLNKTMKKYFEQSYKYIDENRDKVKFE